MLDKFRQIFFYTTNGITIIAPVVLLLMPIDFFDKGESLCLSKQLAGISCYACGMTKAVMHFVHFDFLGAWNFNQLSFIVVPMLFPLWLKSIYEIQGKQLPGLLGRLT